MFETAAQTEHSAQPIAWRPAFWLLSVAVSAFTLVLAALVSMSLSHVDLLSLVLFWLGLTWLAASALSYLVLAALRAPDVLEKNMASEAQHTQREPQTIKQSITHGMWSNMSDLANAGLSAPSHRFARCLQYAGLRDFDIV